KEICNYGIPGIFGGTAEYIEIEVRSRPGKTGYLRESPHFHTQFSLQPSVDRPDFLIPSALGHCRQYDLRAGPRRPTHQQGVWVEVAASSHGKAGNYRSQQKAKCAFAHGAKDLRNPAAERTAPPKTDKRRQHRGSPTGDTNTASCCDPRCTVHRHSSFAGDEIRTPKDNSSAARRDATNNCNGCNCRQPLQEIGTNSQPQAHDSMNPIPRGTFSLWESPNAILQGPNATIGWTGPNAAHLSSSNSKDKTIVSRSIEEHGFRGTLREDETWAKIARTKPRRAGGGTDGVSIETSSLASNPSEVERTKHCLGVMVEATDAAVSACSSKQRCRCFYSSCNGSAVTATDLGPMTTTAGLSLGANGRNPLNLGPPFFASSPSSQGIPASLSASHCWNPLAYENSLLGKLSSSIAHQSLAGNAGHQTSGPSVAPSDQRHIDDALDGMMSDLRRVSSPSSGDTGGDDPRGLDVVTRMIAWEAPFFLPSAVGVEERGPLKPARQLGGRSGDSSRLDRSYRTNISTNIMASPDMDSKRASTARLTDTLRESRVVSFPKDGWQPSLPTAASPKKNEVVRSVAAINPSPSPSPFDWGLESSSFTPVSNNVLKYPTGGFPPSSW
ncbi:unnamed protein product, partial [Ectocarpus sp. 8 AP-2014]